MNKERLLNVSKACRESNRPTFTMGRLMHDCGTPACAFGEYAARPDLQSEFRLGESTHCASAVDGYYSYERACRHFGLTSEDFEDLFSERGCDGALTALEAAEYIERFVAANS